MSNSDRSASRTTTQLKSRPCCQPPRPCPLPTNWARYPATQDVDVSCNRIVDVSGISFCDGTYIGSGNSFDISSNQVLVLSGTVDPSGNYNSASIVSRDRIYQQLDSDPSWNAVNGYYTLAKDAAPALNPTSSGVTAVSTWITRTTNNNQWVSICWSPELGIFVAISESGGTDRAMTSPDGITWTTRTTNSNIWRSVCWAAEAPNSLGGTGLFVAVASGVSNDDLSNNRVMISSNGIDWIPQSINNTNGWNDVCWSPELGLFAAVSFDGSGDRVMTSPNGITWTTRTTNNNSWLGICWSSELGMFVAVAGSGSNDRAMTSHDGITWITRTTNNNTWSNICWSPELGLFAAVANSGSNDRAMTSPDGINWTTRTTNNNIWFNICWSPELGLFVAVSIFTIGSLANVMTSPDGITWTLRTSPNANWRGVCWSPELGIFAAVSTSGSANRAMTSSLRGRPPTSYNVFDSSSNRIDQNGYWALQQTLKAVTYTDISGALNVAGSNLLYANNTTEKTITNFTGGVANQRLIVAFPGAGNTIIQHNASIRLSGGGANFTATQYDTLTLVFTGSVWVEVYRSANI
jgi:hypothetical protein